MARPVRAFLSYRRLDAIEVAEIERQLKLRGIGLWRDVNDLPLGGLTEPEIRRGIGQSDAFILYVSPRVFTSDVIWRVEVPTAIGHARRMAHQGRRYPIVPVLRGVSVSELRRRAALLGAAELPMRNAAFVPLRRGERAGAGARRAAFAALGSRLLRSLMPGVPRGRLSLALRSLGAPGARTTFDLDWSGVLEDATPRTWTEELLPALQDVGHELARGHRRMFSLFLHARLGVGLLAGMVLPLASGFDVTVRDRQGTWPRRAHLGNLLREDCGTRNAKRAVIEVSLAQNARRDATRLSASLQARHIRLTPPTGPSRAYDPRPRAEGIARQLGELARGLGAEGVRDLHLVYAGPAALAFLLGRQLHAVGRVHCYYRDSRNNLTRAYSYWT